MHKLAKGIKGPKEKKEKKAKKGKKSKKKDEELFKPEELEAYRREHSGHSSEVPAQNEEWRKFLSLTSDVDNVLKKTQDDLDRIRSTSFFQRVPPPSEVERERQEEAQQRQAEFEALRKKEEETKKEPFNLGIVEVSESESEEEEDDDIFDTAYIDAVATGQLKLAYIPDSPTDCADGDDPFDTTIADRVILGPAVERKGKKLVPLGAAVEVLTGRVQLPTCATKSVARRQVFKEQNLLLQSFELNTDPLVGDPNSNCVASPPKTLLDDDDVPKPQSPIDLSRSLYIPPPPVVESKAPEDEADLEFEALAAESLIKTPAPIAVTLPVVVNAVGALVIESTDWKPFGDTETTDQPSFNEEDLDLDPFDTTFAENLLPGKAELRVLEKEILENDFDFDPRSELGVVHCSIKNISFVSNTSIIKSPTRDLLGGSTSDLSKLSDTLQPSEDDISYLDPFDTSIVDTVNQPGKAELTFLERELLADIKKPIVDTLVDDDDFNPRFNEKPRERTFSRPDVLNISAKKQVSFDEPIDKNCLGLDQGLKSSKPLTPFYVRKNSVPGVETVQEFPGQELEDPFDTSFVNSAPGKAEIKVLETELFQKTPEEFKENIQIQTNSTINVKPPEVNSVDLLAESHDISTKVLTPAPQIENDHLSYSDPFDTSIVSTLAPGKAELRLLEDELIESNTSYQAEHHEDLLVHSRDVIIEKPLSPQISTDLADDPNFDPFDTTFACNIQPGKAEIRVIESELM